MHSSTVSDHSSRSSEAKLFGIEFSDLQVSKEDSGKPRCDQLDCLPAAPFCWISPEPFAGCRRLSETVTKLFARTQLIADPTSQLQTNREQSDEMCVSGH
jgi:hypothetical protein